MAVMYLVDAFLDTLMILCVLMIIHDLKIGSSLFTVQIKFRKNKGNNTCLINSREDFDLSVGSLTKNYLTA